MWAADNACFNNPQSFTVEGFLDWLDRFPKAIRRRCLFANAPDVLKQLGNGVMVGDAAATIERSLPVLPKIRKLGYPAALVAQDGLEQLDVPWRAFDVLFIGGSTEWKLSDHARKLTAMAKARGKHVHMGRVNSLKRIRIAQSFGCDTVDGTFLAFGPDINLKRLMSWYEKLQGEFLPTPRPHNKESSPAR